MHTKQDCMLLRNRLDHYTAAMVSVTEIYHYRALLQGLPIFLLDGDVGADLA